MKSKSLHSTTLQCFPRSSNSVVSIEFRRASRVSKIEIWGFKTLFEWKQDSIAVMLKLQENPVQTSSNRHHCLTSIILPRIHLVDHEWLNSVFAVVFECTGSETLLQWGVTGAGTMALSGLAVVSTVRSRFYDLLAIRNLEKFI